MSDQRPGSKRLAYIDWMRGLAIVIMIEAHVTDAWTLPADRQSLAFGCAAILAGCAAPMFLFLAGVSVALAASAGQRKLGDPARAAGRVRRRGWEVFGLAYLFRFQAYILNPKAMMAGLLKVDILNIMGPSIVATAALWQVARRNSRRMLVFGGAALAVTLVTPLIRTAGWVNWLPDMMQWYLRPTPGRNNFTLFPWAGFVFAGGMVGVLLDYPRESVSERRFHLVAGLTSLLFAVACYAGSYLPSIYADSQFWTSSPMFFLLRVGLMTATLSAVYFWEQRPKLLADRFGWKTSPMALFGRSSLFVYWVHVELVYGVFTQRFHRKLAFSDTVLAFAVFTLFMYGVTLLKNQGVSRWKAWRAAVASARGSMVEKA
ncbi:MAG TPA: heparan-alpha-glucosaminide N-acetyltransferase domain-containing protein [Vicinamibacterales bacterium]|jgi:uncharacterized membrane protein